VSLLELPTEGRQAAQRGGKPDGAQPRLGDPGEVLAAVFALLDRSGIAYCIVHGYDGLPQERGADVDFIIEGHVDARRLLALIADHRQELGADIARADGLFITLACRSRTGMPQFLSLDFAHDYGVDAYLLCRGEDVLSNRRRFRSFWIPSAAVEFHCLLSRSLCRNTLDDSRTARLSRLFGEDRAGAAAVLRRYWPPRLCSAAIAAATSGDWSPVRADAARLRNGLKWNIVRNSPLRYAVEALKTQLARVRRFLRPRGLNVVLLGPDGAGKSSTIAALETGLAPLFARTEVRGFAPSLRQLLKRRPGSTARPHALKARSLPTSLVRAAYWALYGALSHLTVRYAKARATLILNDRHFIDILVDPVRYRYGGPRFVLSIVRHFMPRPDIVILLDGPAAVLQARKRELTIAETERQARDYLRLVAPLRDSHIVDAAQPFEAVVRDCAAIVLARLASKFR
jgi:thymidylate kinase